MAQRGTIRLVADEIGIDQKTVRRNLTSAGLDPKTVSFEQALPIVRAIVDADRVHGHAVNGRGEQSGINNALAEAKAEAERHRAEKLRLYNERLRGNLIPRDCVTETASRIIAETRTALLALGHRCAEKVVGNDNVNEVASLIESEIRACLGVLADESAFLERLRADDEAALG